MDAWTYEPAADLEQPLIERLRNFPREPDMFVYGMRSATALAIRGWLRLYHGLTIVGSENLPADSSFVLVANHASHLDALCLLSALPLSKLHRAFPAAAQDYFFVSVPRVLLAAVVVNALPFNRRCNPRQSISLCRHLLENPGNILVIFPEGTRSTDGEIGDFKAGIGLFLAGTEIPVVPCYLHGADKGWPKGAWFPKPHPVQLTIGQPRNFSHLASGKESALAIARDLRKAVIGLRDANSRGAS
ncbi:MAG TPA: lysophospholipid acyltransferase family protein, partial [Planctomycetaceae bacterium]|nr:lysophospholipid acyltransferase family protein [Planctomycetaceae bacterium]